MLRRSRGYVPGAHRAAASPAAGQLLACGAELKNTFCVAKGERAWVGHHIGDLKNYETLRSFADGHRRTSSACSPSSPRSSRTTCTPSTCRRKHALEREGVALVGVQHHHAHLAACLAEHGETGPAVGAIFDGTGYGADGTVWGGELLVGDLADFERVGHLFPVRLPGGDAAIREPWRMACAWLAAALRRAPALPRARRTVDRDRLARRWPALARSGARVAAHDERGPALRRGGGAVRLRARGELRGPGGGRARGGGATRPSAAPTRCRRRRGEPLVLDARPTIRAVVARPGGGRRGGDGRGALPQRRSRAATAARVRGGGRARAARDGRALRRRVPEPAAARAHARRCSRRAGCACSCPSALPPNDGGISYGQLAVAAAAAGERRPMFGLDDRIADARAAAAALALVLAVALLLGLRHATTPTTSPRSRR